MFFNKFPLLAYDLTGLPNMQPEVVRNIFFNLAIIEAVKQNTLIYYPYYIKDNETPEDVAYKYYKDSNKHWLVMMVNNIVDPQFDWPMSDMSFQNYINAKYAGITVPNQTVYDNTNQSVRAYLNVIAGGNQAGSTYSSFQVYNQNVINSVTLNLYSTSSNASSIQISIYADNNNSPGALLGVVAQVPDENITTMGFYTFPTNVVVPPNSKCWLGITSPGLSGTLVGFAGTAAGFGSGNQYTEYQNFIPIVETILPNGNYIDEPGTNNVTGPLYTNWPVIMQISTTYNSNPNDPNLGMIIAQSLIDHYTLTTASVSSAFGAPVSQVVTIDQDTYNNTPGFSFQEINLQDGTTVAITTTTAITYAFNQEYASNEAKKNIQLLDVQYANQIQSEFDAQSAAAS